MRAGDDNLRELEPRQLILKKLESVLPYAEMIPEISEEARAGIKTYKENAHKARDILRKAQGLPVTSRELEEALKKFDMLLPEEMTKKIDRLYLEMAKINQQGYVQRMEGPYAVYGLEPTAPGQSFFLKKTVAESPLIYGGDDEEIVRNPLLDQLDRQNAQVADRGQAQLRRRQLAESSGSTSRPAAERDPEASLPVPPVVQGDQIELLKRCSKYSEKALAFALTIFFGYLGSASSSSGSVTMKVAMPFYFIALSIDLISISKRTPQWASALVYVSCFFLVLVTYLLFVSFNKDYSYSILFVALLIVGAILWCKLCPVTTQQGVNNKEAVDQYMDSIFQFSSTIITAGGFMNVVLGYYMVVTNKPIPATAVGFLFFFTIVLGLYLMVATTVRTPMLTFHATNLDYPMKCLVVGTIIAILIYWFRR